MLKAVFHIPQEDDTRSDGLINDGGTPDLLKEIIISEFEFQPISKGTTFKMGNDLFTEYTNPHQLIIKKNDFEINVEQEVDIIEFNNIEELNKKTFIIRAINTSILSKELILDEKFN